MSTPTVYTTQTLSALFKDVYPAMLSQLIPERELLLSTIPFMNTEGGAGGDYVVPFIYNRIHGVTFHGQNDANIYLNPSTATRALQARVRGSSMTMRAAASLTALSRAINGGGSFVDATSYIIENLMESFSAVVEQVNFYGGVGLGQSASLAGEIGVNVTGYTFDANGVDAALNAIRISFAEWAPAIWVGAEGMPIDVYNSAGTVLLCKTEITQVDILNRILIVADASLLAASVAANPGFKIWRKGSKGYEADGVHAILTNTTDLFGIKAGQTSLWYANVHATAGTLNFATLNAGVSKAYARGLEKSLMVHINSSAFGKMMDNFLTTKIIAGGASLTTLTNEATAGGCCRIDDEGNLVYGIRTMKFLINSITVEVVVNDYVKGGYAYGLDMDSWKRVGSSDLRFATEGLSEGNYFFQMPDASAVEIRVFADQALFTDKPARQILFTGLTE